ncbi:MAG: hypothetical protein US30_C0001G0030 [Candidatus Moranbacteria bacterium GW2011_GWF2_36_839]|nr:MAG: hypothetical protein US27_C0001G0030 [Candidatus Moranbacteria bacterium GW2011_GWF1_36_78]KKQ17696.1 MAG: hypothetical protein US30_C0001G0030 [Candidatus Moranbacteria bacterium GW2011_GWF2_36_839]HAT73398.1 hypothetical protein [Candidatus Moranbacteria bacterium]HBY10761.1 hypothetical protein [Candidatus Moranbacteria bacterium]
MVKFSKIKKEIPAILVFIAVISVNLYFGIPRIEKFSAIDEALWSYDRVPRFWKSIKKGNWKGTSLCDKPGVTLAAISGIGLPFIPDPQKYEKIRSQAKTPEQLATIKKIYLVLRLPVYIFTLLSLPFFYFFIKRLWNEKIALLSIIFIGLSPILLGISLIVNTDAILWILMPFSLLSFLVYQKENNRKFLYLAGIILGFSILNKFVANLLFPFFLALIFLKYILDDCSKEENIQYFKKSMRDYFILVLISIATILIFYPNAWIKPIKSLLETTILSMAFERIWPMFLAMLAIISADIFILKSFFVQKICAPFRTHKSIFIKIISSFVLFLIFFVFINVIQEMKYYDFETIHFMPKADTSSFAEFLSSLLSAFYPLIYGIPPITTLFLISAVFFLIFSKNIKEKNNLLMAFNLLSFILVFYLANSIAHISSTVRYQIVIYPLASILAAIGLHEFIKSKSIQKYLPETTFYILITLLILTSIISLRSIRPFFLSYSSEILPQKYIVNPRDMADGSWEASEYLNALPDAKDLVIFSDKKQVCEKFIGKCSQQAKDNLTFDYFVTSRSERDEVFSEAKVVGTQDYKIGTELVNLTKMYSGKESSDFKIIIGGRTNNYVKITSAQSANK